MAILATLALAAGSGLGCAQDEETCAAPTILPDQSPFSFGNVRPPPGNAANEDPADLTRIPVEHSLRLNVECEPVEVTKVCIVGDAHNGDPSNKAFDLQGINKNTVDAEFGSIVTFTYVAKEANTDQDSDGSPDPDNAALVVQSNATNFPTLVIPICGRVFGGNDPDQFLCESPVTVNPGEKNDTLCN